MALISEAILKYYPNSVESLSNLSIVYMMKDEIDKALGYLLRAEKIDPKDYVVLGNIALAYKKKGDKANAIKYYELTELYGDGDAKVYAQKQLVELKKN
jgi:tetratricopeptide (TPR) repeat protein